MPFTIPFIALARNDNPFEIDETPIPLHAWSGQESDPLTNLESDIRRLLRERAEARFAVDEARKQNEETQRKFLLETLDILDAFDRVFRNIHQKEDQVTKQMKIWINNFRTVRRMLEKMLTEHGVTPILNLDGGFDPVWHRAIETVNDPAHPDGFIVEQARCGYLWNGATLRKAEVVIVRNDDANVINQT
ncbi:MAG: nucleotide exchange factor GrpE [Candidatus Contendobacter sp.]|nr:nucleotide exchange factor GrpE [Candidatus Contendobacter sp.]MDS4060684.1 nucleotide exchange factor GrpE [Candidatus Contendobacter sp.]